MVFLFLYPTTISIGYWHVANIIPVTNWYKLEFNIHGDNNKKHSVINFPLDFKSTYYSKLKSFFPAMAEVVSNKNFLINSSDTLYSNYSNEIRLSLDENKCIDTNLFSTYELSAITQIISDKNFDDLKKCSN